MTTNDLNVISKNNSTTTLLTGDAVFTGRAEDCARFSTVTVFTYSDVASAAGGLSLELSTDGVNWDRVITKSVDAGISQVHSLTVVTQYFRVRYTNGSGAQSDFRLQTQYHTNRNRDLSSGTEQVLQKYDDVTLVRTTGDVQFDRTRGRIGYESTGSISGSAEGVSTSFVSVWPYFGTANFYWAEAAAAVRVRAGGDTNDTSAGTGARTILVVGLDENWAEATEVITLAGTSASSSTTTTFIRINAVVVATAGTYTAANTGQIIIEDGSANVWATIEADQGRAEMARYSVPAGKTAYVDFVVIEVSAGNSGSVRTYARQNADDVTDPYSPIILANKLVDFEGAVTIEPKHLTALPPKTDFYTEAIKVSGGGTASIAVIIQYILVTE